MTQAGPLRHNAYFEFFQLAGADEQTDATALTIEVAASLVRSPGWSAYLGQGAFRNASVIADVGIIGPLEGVQKQHSLPILAKSCCGRSSQE